MKSPISTLRVVWSLNNKSTDKLPASFASLIYNLPLPIIVRCFDFALQNYTKKMIYAREEEIFSGKSGKSRPMRWSGKPRDLSDEIGRSYLYFSKWGTFGLRLKSIPPKLHSHFRANANYLHKKYMLLQAEQNFFVQIFVHFKNLLYLCALICEVCPFANASNCRKYYKKRYKTWDFFLLHKRLPLT